MEALFNKEVKVNEEQFEELMELLEEKTVFRWNHEDTPTMYKPGRVIHLGYIYIQFHENGNFLTWDDERNSDCIPMSFEEIKQILTSSPSTPIEEVSVQTPMTEEEYHQKIKEENERHQQAFKEINIEFAKSNDPYQIGDVIKDHQHTGKIIDKKVYLSAWNLPSMVYTCEGLTKSGKPSKRNPMVEIYQRNIKE